MIRDDMSSFLKSGGSGERPPLNLERAHSRARASVIAVSMPSLCPSSAVRVWSLEQREAYRGTRMLMSILYL